jgi:hypothetical protein
MLAAEVEADHLDQRPAAVRRLKALAARCRAAGRADLARWCGSVADELS